MTNKTEAQQRVQTYIDRRKQSRGLDKNHIHGFDAGDSSEAILLSSDLEALLGEIQQLKALLSARQGVPLPVDFKGTDGLNARLHYRRGWREAERARNRCPCREAAIVAKCAIKHAPSEPAGARASLGNENQMSNADIAKACHLQKETYDQQTQHPPRPKAARARQMEPAPLLMQGSFLEECMSKLRLTPAQRTMLHNAVNGKPLLLGLTRSSVSHRTHSTLQALHRAGLLEGINHQPTLAGFAYFNPNKTIGVPK